jgi:NAD-dependent dihydropyrimidine dehydrogenase PreA subunit
MEIKKTAYIDKEKCVGCGACILQCPQGAISLQPGWFSKVDESKCGGCGNCISICHRHAPEWKFSVIKY